MLNNELLCTSKDGKQVYFDPIHSHAATHFADTPQLRELVIEVLKNRDIANNELEFGIDMGRTVGTCDVVDTDDSNDIVYVIRKSRPEQGYVPFVKTRKPQADSNISISLLSNRDGTFQLSSAWIGTWDDPPFPQQPHATPNSKIYWNTHAFVWGSQEIEPGTETETCPW
jgi:hypothetical protein